MLSVGMRNTIDIHKKVFELFFRSIRSLKTEPFNAEILEQAESSIDDESEGKLQRDRELEKKRNKSRLARQHYNIIHGRRPYSEPLISHHNTVKYNRKMFGKYGEASGVNPRILWPTHEDLEKIIEKESVQNPMSLQSMMDEIESERRNHELFIKQRQEEVLKQFALVEETKRNLKAKIAAKEREAAEAIAKRERLIEEVRRHFGFKVDPRDERFKEMLEKKEKEERKRLKEERKKMKESKLMERLLKQEKEREAAAAQAPAADTQ